MPYERGKKVETGIWRLKGSREYLVEVSFSDPDTGERVRRWKTLNRLDLAQRWRRTMQDENARREMGGGRRRTSMTFSDFVGDYLETWAPERKPTTVAAERKRIVLHLVPAFGTKPLSVITRKEIELYLTRRRGEGAKPGTTNRELCRLKNILKKAQEWELIETNPAGGIKQARERIVEQDYLSEDETARLLEVCDERIRPMVMLAVYTGMRWGELAGLRWRDVSFERGTARLRDTKNNEDRYVPLNSEVLKTLKELRGNGKGDGVVFTNPATNEAWTDIRKPFRASLKAAGIDRHIPLKNLRHTAASHLVMNGVDLRTVGQILGHKSLQVTLRYAHLAPDHLQEAVGKLKYRKKETKQ